MKTLEQFTEEKWQEFISEYEWLNESNNKAIFLKGMIAGLDWTYVKTKEKLKEMNKGAE